MEHLISLNHRAKHFPFLYKKGIAYAQYCGQVSVHGYPGARHLRNTTDRQIKEHFTKPPNSNRLQRCPDATCAFETFLLNRYDSVLPKHWLCSIVTTWKLMNYNAQNESRINPIHLSPDKSLPFQRQMYIFFSFTKRSKWSFEESLQMVTTWLQINLLYH